MPDYSLVTGWTITRGRQSELTKTGTGTATIKMIDTTGDLDPTNTGGPFYGDINPMKQAAISLYNPVTLTWHPIFTGFTSEWQFEMDITERFLNVTLECVDLCDILESATLTPGVHGNTPTNTPFADVYFQGTPSNYPDEPDVAKHVDTRINDLLDAAGWPDDAAHRDIFSGNVEVQGKVYERRDSMMSAIADAVDAEFPGLGNFYASRLGVATFHGRFSRFFPGRPGYGINTWAVGDTAAAANPAVAIVSPVGWRRSEADLINSAMALPLGVEDTDAPGQVSEDSGSIAEFGYRSVSFDSLITSAGHDDDNNPTTALQETKKFADYYVGNYSDPRDRIQQLVFRPLPVGHANAAAQWALLCGVEISDIISLNVSFPWGGGFDEDFYVEGINYEADVQGGAAFTNVTLTLDVSPRAYYNSNPFGEFDDT